MNVGNMVNSSNVRKYRNMAFAAGAIASLADQGRRMDNQQRIQGSIGSPPARNTKASYNPALAGVNNGRIRRILSTDDFFDILDLGESATPDEVKEAYLELATEFHPAKSKEVGAGEAFRKLAQAYDCLMDEEKRNRYLKCCQRDREHPERIYRQYYNDDDISPGEVYQSATGDSSEVGYNMSSFNVAKNHGVVKLTFWSRLWQYRVVLLVILVLILLIALASRSSNRHH